MQKTIWLMVVAILFSYNALAYADDFPEFALETIVVTDSAIKHDSENDRITSINMKDKIDAGQFNSVTDLLRDVPGVVITSSQNSGTKISLRGASNDRVLVAINGNVVENQGEIARGRELEWDSIPVSNVKKIEVIRGSGSVVYSGTWGGVINIITQERAGEMRTSLKYSLGSWSNKKYSIANQGTTEDGRLSWSLAADKRDSDGYYRNNWTDLKDINLGLTYNLADNENLRLAYFHMDKKEGIITGNDPKNKDYDPSYPTTAAAPQGWQDGSYRHWKTDNVSLSYNKDAFKASVYQNRQDRNEYYNRLKSGKNIMYLGTSHEIKNTGYNWQNTVRIKNHEILYGNEYKKMDFTTYTLTQWTGEKTGATNLDTGLLGIFVQDNWRLNEKALLTLGLRYDNYQMDSNRYFANNTKLEESKNEFSPKMSFTYQLTSKDTLYVSASRVFRPPTVAHYTKWASQYFTPDAQNPNHYQALMAYLGVYFSEDQWRDMVGFLKPETGMAYELGWNKRISDDLGFRITGFYNDIDNYIHRFFGPGNTSFPLHYNIDNVKIMGLELAADYRLNKNLGVILNFTNQHSKKKGDRLGFTTGSDGELAQFPENTINLGIRYDSLKGFRASWDTRYYSRKQAELGGTVSSCTVTDLAFTYAWKNHSLSLAVNNLFDKDYEETEGFPMPGINYSLAYQFTF